MGQEAHLRVTDFWAEAVRLLGMQRRKEVTSTLAASHWPQPCLWARHAHLQFAGLSVVGSTNEKPGRPWKRKGLSSKLPVLFIH